MNSSQALSVAAFAFLAVYSTPVVAATIELDGSRIATLSEAVAAAQAEDDGPHVINITIDKLPKPDGEVVITEPMTINGDADGNGTKCDILVDVAAIQQLPVSAGLELKSYLEVSAPGKVEISDLMIHPNADGAAEDAAFVDGIRLYSPPLETDRGEYILNRVWVSGSDRNKGDAYVSLESTDDLYNTPGIKRWSRQHGKANRGVIHLEKVRPDGEGEKGQYSSVLNDCHAGLGRGPAVNIVADTGTHKVIGGVYGHSGKEGFRISGETVTLTGSPEKRIKVLRVPNEIGKGRKKGGGDAVTITMDAHVDMMEYVDASALNNARAFLLGPRARLDRRRDCETITDLALMFGSGKPGSAAGSGSAVGWLDPEAAWKQAQAGKEGMLLFFYSENVEHAKQLSQIMKTDKGARQCLSKYACSRVDVKDASGETIAKKYGVFKVPTLLVISPDAQSFKRVSPDLADSWQVIEKQLTAR